MISLSRYRHFSRWCMIAMTVAFVLWFAAFWNSLLSAGVKHEGWVIVFMALVFLSGLSLFFIVHRTTDSAHFEAEIQKAFESGRAGVLRELEKQNSEVKSEAEGSEADVDKTVHQILSGIKTGSDRKMCDRVLSNLGKTMGFVQGIFYIRDPADSLFKARGEYALTGDGPPPFSAGEGLAGQAAESKSPVILYDIPEQYFSITSALGSAKPKFLVLVPVVYEDECTGILELAAFTKPGSAEVRILQRLSAELGMKIHTSKAA